jgi:hypothetical protein
MYIFLFGAGHSDFDAGNIHHKGHWKGWALKLMYLKLSIYLFFYMALGLNDLDAGKSISKAIGMGGP